MVKQVKVLKCAMDLEKELLSLKENLKQNREKFREWTALTDAQCEINNKDHIERTNKYQDELAAVQQNIKMLEVEGQKKKKAEEDINSELKDLEEKIRNGKNEADCLLQQNEQIVAEVHKKCEENNHERLVMEEKDRVNKFQIQELEKAKSYFPDRMGIQLRKVSGNRVQVIFTCIDYKDSSKQFYFFVKIQENRCYEDCVPPVPHLDELVQKLNEENNFKSFIVTLRKKFKETI